MLTKQFASIWAFCMILESGVVVSRLSQVRWFLVTHQLVIDAGICGIGPKKPLLCMNLQNA